MIEANSTEARLKKLLNFVSFMSNELITNMQITITITI